MSANSAAVLVHRLSCQGGESCLCKGNVGAYATKPIPNSYYTLTNYNLISHCSEEGEALRPAGDLFGDDTVTSKLATDVSLKELLEMDEAVIKSCLDQYISDVIRHSVQSKGSFSQKPALCKMLTKCLNDQPLTKVVVDNFVIKPLKGNGYQRSRYIEDLKLAPDYGTLSRAQCRFFREMSFKKEGFDEVNLLELCPSDFAPNTFDAIFEFKVLSALILTGGDSSPTRERNEYCEECVVFFYLHSHLENRYVFLEIKQGKAGKMRYRLSLPEYDKALVFRNWEHLKNFLDAYMLRHMVCSIDTHVFKKP